MPAHSDLAPPPAHPRVSLIYVNWQCAGFIRDSIASVIEHNGGDGIEFLVVDNASPGGDADTLAEKFPHVRILRSRSNLGFAAANNIGARCASSDVLLFLNPDTRLLSPAIDLMLGELSRLPDAGVIGCRLLNADLTPQTSAIQKFPTLWNQLLDAEALRLRWPGCPLWDIRPILSPPARPVPAEAISGACMMIRRAAFEAAGGFPEDYFMYAEDIDLSRRLVQAGHTNWFVGAASIIHFGGQSSPSDWATRAKWRAMMLYFRKHHGPVYALAFRAAFVVAALLRLLLLGAAWLSSRRSRATVAASLRKWITVAATLATGVKHPAQPITR